MILAYVLHKTLGQLCRQAGLGDEPRKVLDELAQIQVIDVVVPIRCGIELRKRCVSEPTDHQAILLHRLGLHLPKRMKNMASGQRLRECSEDFQDSLHAPQ